MTSPLLSICVPTYNRPELVKRTLESVYSDSPDVEYIVTDNSTNGDTEAVVSAFFKGRSCAWQYRKNDFPAEMSNFEKMVRNLNRGVELSRGRFIYIIHDDDFVVENGIARLLERLSGESAEYSVIKFGAHLVDLQGNVKRIQRCSKDRFLDKREALKAVLSNSSFARFPSVLFRRDVYERVGAWRIEAAGPLDFDMYIRAFREFGVQEYREVLGCYTIHDQAQTMNLFNEKMVKLNLSLFEEADPEGLLTDREFRAARAKFFHQFILGGTYRLLKWQRFDDAKKVMDLFEIEQVQRMGTPMKWAPVKIAFGLACSVV